MLLFSSLSGLTLLFYFHLKTVKMTVCVCPLTSSVAQNFFSGLLDTSKSDTDHAFIFFISCLK